METSLVILAAGKGTRMQSDLPKVLHQMAHAPLLAHAMRSGAVLAPAHTVVVAGHGSEAVSAAALAEDDSAVVVLQKEQLGTGHAVLQARTALAAFEGTLIVLYGDTPFIRPETLEAMIAARAEADVVVLGFETEEPGRYGRLKMAGDALTAIVEYKDADEAERAITLCNSGVMACDAALMFALLDKVSNDNAAGEYYLTDLVELARAAGKSATVVVCPQEETLGVDSRAGLARAEALFQTQARAALLELGVTLTAPETVHLAHDTVIGRDVVIEPNVVFGPGVTVETGATIRAFSHLEGCHVSRGASVGPYARLRPGAELAENTRVGNFVEVKNATIAEGAKVSHLSYVGDASIGAGSNIGAGTITCNYDGFLKHRTEIGAGTFIGSNTMLVAPVRVGDQAMTATGSVITRDVEDGALAFARARQQTKPKGALRLFDILRAKKEQKRKEQA
ncbi:MAG: bifunctional UDP-N-acetylglucosamine diphosphorylase/glucosamine-1-phosphate N-acetyltransferase GlmU [Pseudomonadota bacterium]